MLNIWPHEENFVSKEKLNQYITSLKWQLRIHLGVQLRRFSARNNDGDLNIYKSGNAFGESKTFKHHKLARRRLGPHVLVFEVAVVSE